MRKKVNNSPKWCSRMNPAPILTPPSLFKNFQFNAVLERSFKGREGLKAGTCGQGLRSLARKCLQQEWYQFAIRKGPHPVSQLDAS